MRELFVRLSRPERLRPQTVETLASQLAAHAKGRMAVVLEGPAISSMPNWNDSSEAWNSQLNLGAWNLVAGLTDALKIIREDTLPSSERTVIQQVLIDDAGVRRTAERARDICGETLDAMREELPEKDQWILDRQNIHQQASLGDFRNETAFRLQQLASLYEEGHALPLIVLVHSIFSIEHDAGVLHELVGLMAMDDTSTFKQMSKDERRLLITRTYRHVWVNEMGGVICVTQPHFPYGAVSHQEIEREGLATKGQMR